jgi:cytoskeletal protein CcmA (bactofilin family)
MTMKKREEFNAFLGHNTELSFSGIVRIDGHFRGEISTEGTLIVGEAAVVESDVQVAHIIISGEIRGNIVAGRKVEIHAPGRVVGNIQTPVLVVDEGVVFEGNCRMQNTADTGSSKVAALFSA